MLWTTIKLYTINNDDRALSQTAQMWARCAENDPAKQKNVRQVKAAFDMTAFS